MQNERVQWLHPVRVFVWICGVQCSERKLPCQCTYRRPHHPSTTSHRILILVLILVLRMMPFFLLTVITVDKSAQHPVGLGPLVVFLRGIRQHVFGHGHGRSCRHGGTTTPPSERAIALHVRKVGQGNRLDADRWRHGMYVLSKTFLSHPDAFPLCGDGVIVEDPAVGVVGHPAVVVPGPTRLHHSRGYCRSGERPESAQSHGTKTTTVAAVVVATAVCQLVCVCVCVYRYIGTCRSRGSQHSQKTNNTVFGSERSLPIIESRVEGLEPARLAACLPLYLRAFGIINDGFDSGSTAQHCTLHCLNNRGVLWLTTVLWCSFGGALERMLFCRERVCVCVFVCCPSNRENERNNWTLLLHVRRITVHLKFGMRGARLCDHGQFGTST